MLGWSKISSIIILLLLSSQQYIYYTLETMHRLNSVYSRDLLQIYMGQFFFEDAAIQTFQYRSRAHTACILALYIGSVASYKKNE